MRYISDDRKVFNTEQQCCEYEQQIRQNKENEEKLRAERQNKLNIINRKYEELQNLLSEFEKDYVVRQRPYVASFYEILDILHG